jgi:hypothetical protein
VAISRKQFMHKQPVNCWANWAFKGSLNFSSKQAQ